MIEGLYSKGRVGADGKGLSGSEIKLAGRRKWQYNQKSPPRIAAPKNVAKIVSDTFKIWESGSSARNLEFGWNGLHGKGYIGKKNQN